MRSSTYLGLHFQTSRLVERLTPITLPIEAAYGILTLSDALFQRTYAPIDSIVTINPKTTIRRTRGLPDSKFELCPLHSPLLRASLLVSFPSVSNMLKSTESSCLIRGRDFEVKYKLSPSFLKKRGKTGNRRRNKKRNAVFYFNHLFGIESTLFINKKYFCIVASVV